MFVIYVRNQQQKQKTMDKVVILARVSTDRQEYQRQINELTAYCDNVGWEVAEIFANKVSGAKKLEEREEIQNLVAYVKEHQIKRVMFGNQQSWSKHIGSLKGHSVSDRQRS